MRALFRVRDVGRRSRCFLKTGEARITNATKVVYLA
jgi:hypothetical protein